MYWCFPEKRKDKKKPELCSFSERTSEFDSACLNPATVHFPIGGMDGEAEAYDDDGDCNGCPDGGGKRRLCGLGEGVAGVVGLRPRAEAWGSAVEPGRGGSALEPAEGGALEPEA